MTIFRLIMTIFRLIMTINIAKKLIEKNVQPHIKLVRPQLCVRFGRPKIVQPQQCGEMQPQQCGEMRPQLSEPLCNIYES